MPSRKPAVVYLVIALIVLNSACGTETLVTKIDPKAKEKQKVEGVLFSLPETVVVAEVPLTKVASTPGIFYEWTEFFYPELTSNDFVTEEKTTFKIGTPTFSTRGQTDPNNVYMAHIKAKAFETKTLLLEFNEDGIIARTEASSKDESIDIITSGIKTLASFTAPFLPIGAGANAFKQSADVPEDCQARIAASKAATAKANDARVAANAAAAVAVNLAAKGKRVATQAKAAQAAANKADDDADAAEVVAATERAAASACITSHIEDHFKEQLSERELALYESLSAAYKQFLRDNFGYDFLIYVAKKDSSGSERKSANIEFFFTLSKPQREFIEGQLRSAVRCVGGAVGTKCIDGNIKIELLKAKAVYDKIQELRLRRENFLSEVTPAQVNSSANLEYRLKELDGQIKSLEETYFLGSSAETSSSARFEFKPTAAVPAVPAIPPALAIPAVPANLSHNLFTYAAGGSAPGICKNSVPNDTAGIFHAVWPRKLEGSCHGPTFLFESGDFRDLKQLAARLYAGRPGAPAPPAGTPPDLVSAYLYGQLSGGTTPLLSSPLQTPQQVSALVAALSADLNGIINGPSIYSPATFVNVKLSPDTLKLVNTAGLAAPKIVELNRLLIEDAFKKEIYRQKASASHQVALSVEPPPPSLASAISTAVANEKLTEPGKRGFPYRVAPSTIAMLTDDDVEKGRSDVRVAQFGPIQTLPAGLGGRRSSYKITYYDASGAIKVFDMSADALVQKQNITDLTDAATILRDAETSRIKRQTDLINAKKDKLTAEKALLDAQKALTAAQGQPSPSPTP